MDISKKVELEKNIESFKSIDKKKIDIEASFIKGQVYDVTLNDGNIIRREKLIKGNSDGSAVIIVPFTQNENTILVIEPRVFTKRTVGVGFPAGYIEEDEEARDAALRELKEEIGYVPKKLTFLGGFYQDSGCSSAFNQVFLAEECEKICDQVLDSDEYIKYFECKFEDIEELIDNSYIEGANSIIAYQKVLKYMKRSN